MWELITSCLFLLTLPSCLELLLLFIGDRRYSRKKRVKPVSSSVGPMAVVIPAHNEEKTIALLLNQLKKCSGSFDLLVIADNCTDRTAEIVRERSVRVIERDNPKQRGKPFALQMAFDLLLKEGYEWIVVLDADAIPDKHFFEQLSKASLYQPSALQASYTLALPLRASWGVRWHTLLFGTYNLLRARGRAGWDLSCGIFGNGWALHRDTLEKVPYKVDSIVEDLMYHLRLIEAHQQVTFVPTAKVSAFVPASYKGHATQQARWIGGRWHVVKQELMPLIRRFIKGQKDLLEPILDLLSLPLTYFGICLLPLLFAPWIFLQLYSLFGMLLLILYLWRGTELLNRPKSDLLALIFYAPGALIRKIALLPKIFKTAKSRQWHRTERD